MLFTNKIKLLREDRGFLQRKLSASLEIDTPTYSKIERDIRPAKRTHLVALVQLLSTDEIELLTHWLVDKILEVLNDERELAVKRWE